MPPELPAAPVPPRPDAGLTLLEVLIAASLALVLAIGAFDFLDATRRSYARETDRSQAQATGRGSLDLVLAELRAAGWSPLGRPVPALLAATPGRVRALADLDGDGLAGGAGELDEDLTWLFRGPDGGGAWTLERGLDGNGDGDFADAGESVDVVARDVVPVDLDRDGAPDPFLAYDAPLPATTRVRVAFGVRSARRDPLRRTRPVVPYQGEAVLRNRLALPPEPTRCAP